MLCLVPDFPDVDVVSLVRRLVADGAVSKVPVATWGDTAQRESEDRS